MTVESIYIRSFGMLRNFTLTFDEGVNIIYGGNESGKSTVAAFIRFMLYGFSQKDGGAEAKRFANYETLTADGTMTVRTANGHWEVNRKVVLSPEGEVCEATATVLDLHTGEPVTLESTPGEFFMGVGRDLYESAAFVPEPHGLSESNEILTHIENLVFSPKRQKETEDAIDRLEGELRSLSTDVSAFDSIPRLQANVENLQSRLSSAMSTQHEILRYNALYEQETRAAEVAAENKARFERQQVDYQNHLLLLAFEKMHQVECEAEELAAEKEAFLATAVKADYLPDDAYLTAYENARDDYLSAKQAARDATDSLTALEAIQPMTGETQKNLIRADKHGGEDAIWGDYQKKNKTYRLFLALSILTGVLGVGTMLPAIFLIGNPAMRSLQVILLVAAGALVIAGVILTVISRVRYKALTVICEDYGAKNGKELRERMKAISVGRADSLALTQQIRQARVTKETALETRVATHRQLTALLARWDASLPEEDEKEFFAAFEKELNACLATYRDISVREAEISTSLYTLHDTLDCHSEEHIRSLLPESRRPALDQTSSSQIQEQIDRYEVELHTHKNKASIFKNQTEVAESFAEQPAALCELLCAEEAVLDEKVRTKRAIETALSLLRGADDRLRAELAPKLAYYVRELTDVMTDGKYPNMTVREDLTLTTLGDNGTVQIPDGAHEVAFLALRLSLIRLLFGETPTVCLDNSLSIHDEARAQAILQVFMTVARHSGIQSLIFTRYDREYRFASECGDCRYVRLA